ncbi:MAG: amidohydrolase family protein [Boseongicola sp.]
MRIDAHQHFWSLARGDYGWLTPALARIYRDFQPDDLAPLLAHHEIDGTVLVQAAPTIAETEYMLTLAGQYDFIKGVVGWVDFESREAPGMIAQLAKNPVLVGLRPMIQDISDVDWVLRPDLQPAFEALESHNLTFDALTLPQHLSNLLKLLERHPEMHTVIDHGSKPLIREGITQGWAEDMALLAHETSAYCKVSGLVTEASADWSVADLKPYVDHLVKCFGPGRLIWGSDWPVCTLAASYSRWVEVTEALLGDLSIQEVTAVMGGNAQRAYHLSG